MPSASSAPVARINMLEGQLRPNRVVDARLLAAMGDLPREDFVPPALAALAYVDEDLPVGPGRFLLEPMVLARLIQALEVGPQDRVLDVAPATGYSTAVLARLAGTVVALEPDIGLLRQSEENLARLDIHNVPCLQGEIVAGVPAHAPYQAILVNGALAELPVMLTDQLAEGGRLVAVLRPERRALGVAHLYQRRHGMISARPLFDAGTPYLPGQEPVAAFVF